MAEVTTVGVDLAKSVFTVHGVDVAGRTVLRKTVRREKLLELIAALPPCWIGMEACSGAHEWARRLEPKCGPKRRHPSQFDRTRRQLPRPCRYRERLSGQASVAHLA